MSKSNHCSNADRCTVVEVARTAFVDRRFGSDRRAQLEAPGCPFRTIASAIAAVAAQTPSETHRWTIHVNPGTYSEAVNLPIFVNLVGSGIGTTFISSVSIVGTSTVSRLTIAGSSLPLLSSAINGEEEAQNQAVVANVSLIATDITSSSPVIRLTGSGINNQILFEEILVNAVSSNLFSAEKQVLFSIEEASVILSTASIFYLAHYSSPVSVFDVTGQLQIFGGRFEVRVRDGPAGEVNFYDLHTGSAKVVNNTAAILILQLHQPYLADVSYIKSEGASRAVITQSNVNLSGISVDFLNLVHNLNSNADIQLLSVATPDISVPRLKGETRAIIYSLQSGYGDLVNRGGFYAGIKTVDGDYFVQESDYTILSTGTSVNVFDPALANLQVLDIGKILNIKNIGTGPLTVKSQDDSIFDGILTVFPFQGITLQNDGIKWYVISRT